MKTFLTGFFLLLSFIFIGFVLVAGITGKFFVSTADGLAGGAIVFFYGVFGAAIGLIAAIFILRKSETKTKRILAILGTVISLASIMIFQSRFEQRKTDKELEKKELVPTESVRY